MDNIAAPSASDSPSNSHSNDVIGSTPNSGSATSSRKRGLSVGIGDDIIEGNKKVLKTDSDGAPYFPANIVNEYATRLGIIARRDIPICYDDWRRVPKDVRQKAVDTLGLQFVFEDEETIDTEYTWKKFNEIWRNYKSYLYNKYVKDQDPSKVKEESQDGIPLEDWRKFVDICNSDKYQKMSRQNVVNRAKQTMPACSGRKSVAVVRHNISLDKGVPISSVGRAETYMSLHTRKDKAPQNKDVEDKIKNYMAEHPESQATSVNDALTNILGPDGKGRMRALPTGVCKTIVRKASSLLKKNAALMEKKSYLEKKIDDFEATMLTKIEEHVRMMFQNQERAFTSNVSSPSDQTSSSSASLMENDCIGKEHYLLGGWPLRHVAKGVVLDVNPDSEVGDRKLGEGNSKVYVTFVNEPSAELPYPHDRWIATLGQVGQGFVIWKKSCLEIISRSS